MLGGREGIGPVLNAHGGEECLETIEVTLRDRVVLVIMAARAPDCETEKHLSDGARQFVQNILAQLSLEIGIRLPGSHAQEAQRDQVLWTIPATLHLIAGKLFLDEAVIPPVLIEGSDNVVPIAPRGGALPADSESVRLAKARQVQPVPAPSLTIAGIR